MDTPTDKQDALFEDLPPPKRTGNRPVRTEGKQYLKSQKTRKLILDTAVRCFVKYGYHQTTAQRIAEEAGLSRGAMRHHFHTKIDIVEAAIEYLFSRRLRAFRSAIEEIPADVDRIKFAVEAFWEQVKHPRYLAFFELSIASRTDEELAAVLAPAEEHFNREYLELATELFPEWEKHRERLQLALNLVRYLLEGMALDAVDQSQEDRDAVLATVENLLRDLRDQD